MSSRRLIRPTSGLWLALAIAAGGAYAIWKVHTSRPHPSPATPQQASVPGRQVVAAPSVPSTAITPSGISPAWRETVSATAHLVQVSIHPHPTQNLLLEFFPQGRTVPVHAVAVPARQPAQVDLTAGTYTVRLGRIDPDGTLHRLDASMPLAIETGAPTVLLDLHQDRIARPPFADRPFPAPQ